MHRILALACLVLPVAAQEGPAHVRAWEHETSDLPVDSRLHFGHFENGLRWVWARNAEPRERSYLRLHVNAGSLAEEDSERGMAHFLEHMAFNGSEHFQPDTLVEWFQLHGMAFGADLNAHTDFGETVYELDLPTSEEGLLDEGLLVLRDFAFGLSLTQAEIDKEKGVIDGEQRERDSAGYRLFVRQIESVLGETRLDERIPIGVPETRARFTAESMRAFYRRWYRPENMTLILVGDLGELDPEPLFAKHFGSVPVPSEPLVPEPGPGKVTTFARRLCLFEAEIPTVSIRIEKLRPWEDRPFTSDRWLEDTPLSVARDMIDLRFRELAKAADAPFLGAGVGSAEALRVLDGESLEIGCAPEKWREAMAAGEQELRRALAHGFQRAELEEIRANALRSLREDVEREATQTSSSLIGQLLGAAERRYVPTSAATRRAILEPFYETLSAEDCHAALVEAWTRGELSIVVTGKLDLGKDPAPVLDEVLEASRAVEVSKGAEITEAEFGYPPADEAAAVVEGSRVAAVEDLDFRTAVLPNGVRLCAKRTDFKERQILFRVSLGEGRLSLDKEHQALGWMADHVFEDGGVGKHTVDELRRMLAGRQVATTFSVGPESFSFSGATTAEDLDVECALLCAFVQDPGWRPEGYDRVQKELPLMYEALGHQHQGPIARDFMDALFAGDERFAFFEQEHLAAVKLDEVRAWMEPFLREAPIEITLVGDLEWEAALSAVARTFGALPERRALRPYDEHRDVPAPLSGIHQVHAIDTQIPKSMVMIAFPVPDERDAVQAARLQFLAEVLRDRLRVEVRERLGAAYSPNAVLQQSDTFPGVGLLILQAITEPGEAEALKEACLAVTDALAKDGVTSEEVERLREPVLKNLRDARRQNGWWLAVLARSFRKATHLDEVRNQVALFQGMQAEPLTDLARAYLPRARSSTVIVNPAQ